MADCHTESSSSGPQRCAPGLHSTIPLKSVDMREVCCGGRDPSFDLQVGNCRSVGRWSEAQFSWPSGPTGLLTDEQWAVPAPLLPKGARVGPPLVWPRRQLIDGIRIRVRTGVPWRDVPVE
ncbi:transposase [Streptomyces sp. NPDC091416]|uniref:transposase n=1 Tax=Streptomyces sp. NPDC091416 TaxID=3366003 RepID=UPI0037F94E3C